MVDDIERRIELERVDAERCALERAIKSIESLVGNEIYCKAWKVAVRRLRDLQGKLGVNCKITDHVANA